MAVGERDQALDEVQVDLRDVAGDHEGERVAGPGEGRGDAPQRALPRRGVGRRRSSPRKARPHSSAAGADQDVVESPGEALDRPGDERPSADGKQRLVAPHPAAAAAGEDDGARRRSSSRLPSRRRRPVHGLQYSTFSRTVHVSRLSVGASGGGGRGSV